MKKSNSFEDDLDAIDSLDFCEYATVVKDDATQRLGAFLEKLGEKYNINYSFDNILSVKFDQLPYQKCPPLLPASLAAGYLWHMQESINQSRQNSVLYCLSNFELFYSMARLRLEKNDLKNDNDMIELAKSVLAKENGKKGAQVKNKNRVKLVKFALSLASQFPDSQSANSIAHEIQEAVLQKGLELNYTLTPQNAKDTIQKWINEDRNKS